MLLGLESVVFQQDHHLIGYGWKDVQPMGGGEPLRSFVYDRFGEEGFGSDKINNPANWGYNSNFSENYSSSIVGSLEENGNGMNVKESMVYGGGSFTVEAAPVEKRGRQKRRRAKIAKNSEEIESQRMTHIAVERNRRKQMNEYLSVLRSMMPPSYTQRGDQASIVGGTIKFVKELEQLLKCLEAEIRQDGHHDSVNSTAENRPATVNVEVTVIESYANIKVMAENRSKQLLKVVVELHSLHLLILHINVTTIRQMVLYCFSVKIEDECKVSTVGEITAAVNEMFERIHMEKV